MDRQAVDGGGGLDLLGVEGGGGVMYMIEELCPVRALWVTGVPQVDM